MKEFFFATNKTGTVTVHVFEKRRRYIVAVDAHGSQKIETFRDIDSAVSLFNALVKQYTLEVTVLGGNK